MNNLSKRNIIKISLITFLWLAVINTGLIMRADTLVRLSITHTIWTGEPEVQLDTNHKPLTRMDNKIGIIGRDGKRYYTYEVGQSLLMLPGDWLGTTIHQLIPRIPEELSRRFVVNWLIFLPINIAVVISAYYLLIKLEFSEKIATISSITWLLTTTVLNYAQNHQQNNQVLLFVILTYIAIFNYLKNNKIINIYLSGVALGCAFLVRTTSIIHIATTLLFLFGILLYKRKSWPAILQSLAISILGAIPVMLINQYFNFQRFGKFWTLRVIDIDTINTDPFLEGLPKLADNYPMINHPSVGILGVLFSPAKSIFIYDPLLLPCLMLTVYVWKTLSPYLRGYILTALLNLILFTLATSRFDFWHGDSAWGARYQVTSIHLLLIPLIALLIQYLLSNFHWRRWLIITALIIAFIIQIASVSLSSNTEVSNLGMIFFAPPKTHQEFRLGSRFRNITCLLTSSWCIESSNSPKATPLIQRVDLFPFFFTDKRNLILVPWLVLVIFTLVMTWQFYKTA